jgi:uncharacterized membrane protein
MFTNIFLALSGILFCYLFLKSINFIPKTIFFVLWILFVPNSIYLVTDIQYFLNQFYEVSFMYKFLISLQFFFVFILGIITYFASIFPIEARFKGRKVDRTYLPALIFLFNFFIAFAVALGKTERTHSWYVFLNPGQSIKDIFSVLSSNESMLFVFVFGLVLNIMYFYFSRKYRLALNKLFSK